MSIPALLKTFPPPRFLVMEHAGLEISDDAIRCLQFTHDIKGKSIAKYSSVDIPLGLVQGGEVKDESAFAQLLKDFDLKNNLSHVKVSIPEEKAYLFQTEVPSNDLHIASQNIEFKLEENVPLSAKDAVFYFDFLPLAVTGGVLKASVSVVSRLYIEKQIKLMRSLGIYPIAFEVVPTAIARTLASPDGANELIVHSMKNKTGFYIVSGGVVVFTSTISQGSQTVSPAPTGLVSAPSSQSYTDIIVKEVSRVQSYWASRGGVRSNIDKIILTGSALVSSEQTLRIALSSVSPVVEIAKVWRNTPDIGTSTMGLNESLDYAVSAGLATDA